MIQITQAGMDFLEQKLRDERKELEELSRAKGAEYGQDGWHDEQYKLDLVRESTLRGQISRREEEISQYKISEPEQQNDQVSFGSRVVLIMDGDEETYTIDGYSHSDKVLSTLSPIGAALIGKRAGELVTFETHRGKREVLIKEILPPIE